MDNFQKFRNLVRAVNFFKSTVPLSDLRQALEDGNLIAFQEALVKDDVDFSSIEKGYEIFERACLKPKSGKFIELLITHCKIDVFTPTVNLKKLPVYLAMQSMDIKNFQAVCDGGNRGSYVNQKYDGETNMHMFFKLLNDKNFDKLFIMIRHFVKKYKAELLVNELDKDGKSPILILLENEELNKSKIKQTLTFLMNKLKIDFDVPAGKPRKLVEENFECIKIPTELMALCLDGDSEKLEEELKKFESAPKIEEPLVVNLVKFICQNKQKAKHLKCLDVLLADKHIKQMIHIKDYENESTALHYAINSQNEDLILKLLEKSAYMGTQVEEKYILQDVKPKILEKHLDKCLSSNSHNYTDQQYEIFLDYSSIIPPDRTTYSSSSVKFLQFISQKPEYQNLIMHPLIYSFLYLKWLTVKFIFHINILISSIYFVVLIYFFTVTDSDSSVTAISLCLFLISVLMYIVVVLHSYLNFSILNLIPILILFPRYTCNLHDYPFYYIYIMIAGFELLFYLKGAALLSISKHFFLFKKVLLNFLQAAVLYFFCIVTFALAFYKVYRDYRTTTSLGPEDDHENQFHSFYNPKLAVMKSLIMSIGEFDAGDFHFMNNEIFIYMFVIFIITITIVLSNLLIGIAVADTEDILKNAELREWDYRIQIMLHNEFIMPYLSIIFPNSWVNILFAERKIPEKYIVMYPNRGNIHYIRAPDSDKSNEENTLVIYRDSFSTRFFCKTIGKIINLTLDHLHDINKKKDIDCKDMKYARSYEYLAKKVKDEITEYIDNHPDYKLNIAD